MRGKEKTRKKQEMVGKLTLDRYIEFASLR